MLRSEFELLLNQTLSPNRFKDYAPNGLQVEGKKEISRVVTGVTACQALIDAAIEYKADAIFCPPWLFFGKTKFLRLLE